MFPHLRINPIGYDLWEMQHQTKLKTNVNDHTKNHKTDKGNDMHGTEGDYARSSVDTKRFYNTNNEHGIDMLAVSIMQSYHIVSYRIMMWVYILYMCTVQ